MNLLHLKYAVEIAQTNSITKAAERLYTAQPSLSRAVRELENSLGIEIFKRTTKGIYPTEEGEEFLNRARKILAQVDEIEAFYKNENKNARQFSISVPRACYISCAFTDFVKKVKTDCGIEFYYKETNSHRAISNILNADYKLGILRYQTIYERYFLDMLQEKGLTGEKLYEFTSVLVMSENHPLAKKDVILLSDLNTYIEIAHSDPFVPTLPLGTVRKNEHLAEINKHIYVFERGSQLDLLSQSHETFMWVSPIPRKILDKYGLVERICAENERKYRDVFIKKNEYRLSDIDRLFLNELSCYTL